MITFQVPGLAPAAPRSTPAAIEGLRLREIELKSTIARLDAQRPILEGQMRSASNGGLRMAAEHELFQAKLQVAASRAELTAVQEQLALQGMPVRAPGGGASTVQPPRPRTFWDRIDNDAITGVFFMTSVAILLPLSIGIARRLWRRPVNHAPTTSAIDALSARFDRLEQAVDTVAIEIERVSESQRFVAKVLSERPSAPAPASHVDNDVALGEAKPFLALGAGPIEAIPVVQRQAVRQSITPH